MSNVRFLDSVSVSAFASTVGNSTATGGVLPSVILPGQTFTVSSNTSVSAYRLTVAGTLNVQAGPQIELPDGSIIYANGQLFLDDLINLQGTINNSGLIEVGGVPY